MKLSTPATTPMRKPKFSPIADRPTVFQHAKKQADERLPAHEACERTVDVAGEPSHILAMARRDEVIDDRDGVIPVEQHIERHHGRDDDERNDIDQRIAAPQQRFVENRRSAWHPGSSGR